MISHLVDDVLSMPNINVMKSILVAKTIASLQDLVH